MNLTKLFQVKILFLLWGGGGGRKHVEQLAALRTEVARRVAVQNG
jgi:hypothetical protein